MDDKVYVPEIIQDSPFPSENVNPVITPTATNPTGTYTQTTTKPNPFPRKMLAVELLSTALNTRSRKILQQFKLDQSGGIQVGDFEEGISGDLRITPNGLTARDIAGLTTFAIDGLTGDAYFRGSLVLGGDLTIQNEEGTAIVDSTGIISSSNFNFNSDEGAASVSGIGTSYVDIASPQTTFTIPDGRNVSVLVFGTIVFHNDSSNTSRALITDENDNGITNTVIAQTGGTGEVNGTFIGINTFSPGTHTLKLRVKSDVGTTTVAGEDRVIGYLILGK